MVTCIETHLWISQPNFYFILQIQLITVKSICWQVFSKNIFTTSSVYLIILCREHSVSFLLSPSPIHLVHPWTAILLSWIRGDVTIVVIGSECKNVTQAKQRHDMRLTSWLMSRVNQVWKIFLCGYELSWTWTESQEKLDPVPSQVLSQVLNQDW